MMQGKLRFSSIILANLKILSSLSENSKIVTYVNIIQDCLEKN